LDRRKLSYKNLRLTFATVKSKEMAVAAKSKIPVASAEVRTDIPHAGGIVISSGRTNLPIGFTEKQNGQWLAYRRTVEGHRLIAGFADFAGALAAIPDEDPATVPEVAAKSRRAAKPDKAPAAKSRPNRKAQAP
jgi:hypothetical protein